MPPLLQLLCILNPPFFFPSRPPLSDCGGLAPPCSKLQLQTHKSLSKKTCEVMRQTTTVLESDRKNHAVLCTERPNGLEYLTATEIKMQFRELFPYVILTFVCYNEILVTVYVIISEKEKKLRCSGE